MTPSLSTLELILETVAIQALVLSVLFFARRRSAATQHLCLSAAVLTVLAVTAISPLVPSWQLGVIPIHATAGEPELLAAPRVEERTEGPAGGAREAIPSTLQSEQRDHPDSGRAWPGILAVIWLLGSALLLLWMMLGLAYSWWLSRRARPPDSPQLEDRFRWALEKVGLRPGVALVESESLRIPVVFGFIRPRVILPTRANRWSEDRLRAVLLHESAHIRRKDLVFQFLAKLTCALYWFNPLTWLIERRLFLAGERAADDQVIRQDVSPADYAEHLMETSVELGTERNPIWATAAMAEGTAFKDRILSILDPNIRRGEPNMSSQAAVTLSALALAMSLLAFSPWKSASAPADQTPSSAETMSALEAAPVDQGTTPQGLPGDIETLLRMLRMEDPAMREHAATALGELGNVAAVLPLIDVILNDRVAGVREHACTALGVLGDARASTALGEVVLRDPNPSVREHAAIALRELRNEAAVLPLIDVILNDRNARAREHACEALGGLGDDRATTPLIEVMRTDPDERVREHAATALGQLGDRRSYDVLLATMSGSDVVRVRAHAAYALGLLGDTRALDPLLAALRDESAIMRMNAAMGLGELGESRAVDMLGQAQNDPDADVRFNAGEALRKIRGR